MNSNDTNNLGVTPNPVTPPPQGSVDPVSPTPTAAVVIAPTAPVTPETTVIPAAPETPAPVSPGSVPPSTPEGKDDKKKLIIIIGVVILLVIVVVLIVLSNTSDEDKESNNNSSSGNTSNKKDEDEGHKTIYFYSVKSDDYEDKMAVFNEVSNSLNSANTKYELISTYECKSDCMMDVTLDYDDNNNREQVLIIKDGDNYYEYDESSKKYNELSITKTLDIKSYTFALTDTYILGYSDEELTAYKDEDFDALEVSQEKISGVTTYVSNNYYTTRELINDDLVIVKKDYKEYQIYQLYKKSSKIAENKIDGESFVLNVEYDKNFVVMSSGSNDRLIIGNNGKVQVNVNRNDYAIKDGKLAVINDKKGIDVYDIDKKIKTYECEDSRVTKEGYGVYLKDHKITFVDLVKDQELYVSDEIGDNFVMKDYQYSRCFSYDEYFNELELFLEDTKKEHENGRALGIEYSYNIKTKEIKINQEASFIA